MFDSKLIKKISSNKIFGKAPIILMHVGATGSNFNNWKNIAENSIIVILDGKNDKEDVTYGFKKIIKENAFISDKNGLAKFYLTKDPGCSSLLKPDYKIHSNWYGSHRFKIKDKIIVKTISLSNFLLRHNIKYIDWFIIDIQGMDLLVFKSLSKKIKRKTSIVNIESGFEKFYEKEEPLPNIINYMNKMFDLSDIKFGYNYKVKSNILSKLEKKLLFLTNKPSKMYANLIFTNKSTDKRSILIKTIYLISSNRLLEAKDLINQNLNKYKSLITIKNDIETLLMIKKIFFLITFPYFYIKKYLNNIGK